MNRTEQALLQAAQLRPVVLRDAVSSLHLRALRRLLIELPDNRWAPGDSSAHTWQECLLRSTEIRSVTSISPAILRFTELASRTAAWINSFGPRQWIGRHRDADGDAQLIIPLSVPSFDQGGQLWVGTKKVIVPVQVGDLLIFNASSIAHGTTPTRELDAQRVTLNIRLWQ